MIKHLIFLCILGFSTGEESDCFEHGVDYSGTNVNNGLEQHTDSATDCQRLCLSTPGCNYFSWADSSFPDPNWRSACWLKSDVTGRKNNPHFVSGPRSCSPGCDGGNHGIPCCPEYVNGDNVGDSEIQIEFNPHTHTSCENTCKAQHPTSVGVTLPTDESRCYCEFGPAFLNVADQRYKTCLFSKDDPDYTTTTVRPPGDCHDYIYLGGPGFEFFYQFGYMKKQYGKSSYSQIQGGHILKYQAGTGWVVTVSDSVDDILAYTEDPAECVYEATTNWWYLDQGEWLADSDLRARVSPEEQCKQDAMCAGCNLILGWNGHDWCCSSECDYGWIDLPGGGCVCGH